MNLTRAEARERAALVTVDRYEVALDFTRDGDTFGSTTEVIFDAADGASTFLDLVVPAVREITLNGRAVDVSAHRDGRVRVDGLAAHNTLRIVADAAYMNTGEGLHRTVDPVDGRTYLYTHFEVPEARRMFASFEQPDLKASFVFTVTAPAGWEVMSNSPTPPPSIDGDTATWRFAPTPRISTYITAVVAGEYHVVRDSWTAPDGTVIPLALACRRSLAPYLDPGELFEITRQGFGHFTAEFGLPYPFAKYDQVFVPEYNIGAMENVGCVTFSETHVYRSAASVAQRQSRAETILHEMAHMWFGDLVTMRWWDDLWLKESFATYVSVHALVVATRFTNGWTSFAFDDKLRGLRADQLPSTHPIVADIDDWADVALNFDGITYSKGAAVLKQLVAWVGPDGFRAGVRRYLEAHAWGNTTLDDLLAALEKASGRDLTAWSREWLQSAGPNTLRPVVTASDGRYDSFEIHQTAPAGHPTLRSHRIAVGGYDLIDGALVRTHRVELDVVGAVTPVPALVGRPQPDLVLVNDDDLTYAGPRFDDRSLATLRAHLGDLVDPLARAVAWTGLWDMVRAGELGARDYLTVAARAIATETEISVVELAHTTMRDALDYVAPEHAAGAAATLAAVARRHLAESAPGGDLQRAWAKLAWALAASDADLAWVAAIRDGDEVIEGLAMDPEARWSLLAALARRGRVGDAEIDAELALDDTTSGHQYAAGARAARPTAEAKAAAWSSLVDRHDLPNRTQDMVAGGGRRDRAGVGFMQTSQAELLRPYVARYWDAVASLWATRTMEIGRTLVTQLYPRAEVSREALARADEFLAGDHPAALRRLIAEARSEVARTLAARERDAADR